jgi:hypothetical protein
MLNAAALSIEELRAARIDREEEFSKAYAALAKNIQNVLLFGTRGAGKTFLIRLIEDELHKQEPQVFTCAVNLASLGAYQPNSDEIDVFPRAVLLQLCAALWTRLFDKPYLDLKDHLSDSGQELRAMRREEATVQAVYAQLMKRDRVRRTSRTNTAGLNLVAKGELQEQFVHEDKQSPVLPFEFGEFVGQLITDALHPRGKTKVVILCDEANHAQFYEQEQLLERYFELFSSRRVQFLFVAGHGPWREKEYIPSCFETTIELAGFKNAAHTKALVQADARRLVGSEVEFTQEAIEVLVESFAGHPINSLNASQRAIDLTLNEAPRRVTVKEMFKACRETEKQLQAWENSVRGNGPKDA